MKNGTTNDRLTSGRAGAVLLMILALVVALSLTACGGNTENSGNENAASGEEQEEPKAENSEGKDTSGEAKKSDGKTLVVYFSSVGNADFPEGVDADSSASINVKDGKTVGNAGVIADYISEATGAKTWEIQVKDKYPGDYDKIVSVAKTEQEKKARPKLAAKIKDFNKYDTFYLAYPNWWYDIPMPLYSFFDEYDFSGKTINVFVTHGGSGFSGAIDTIKELEPKATVNEGLDFYMTDVDGSKDAITDWVNNN